MSAGRKIAEIYSAPDSALVLPSRPESQIIGRTVGAVAKKSGTASAPTTVASDEMVLGPGWDDMLGALTVSSVGSVQPPTFVRMIRNAAGTTQGVYAWSYSGTAENEQFIDIQMSHTWRKGTRVYPHVHISPVNVPGNQDITLWGLEYTLADPDGDAFGNTVVIYGSIAMGVAALAHFRCPLTSENIGLDISAFTELSVVLKCRVFRPVLLARANSTLYHTGNGTSSNPDIIGVVDANVMYFYQCTVQGNSGGAPPAFNHAAIGDTTVDGAATWTYICKGATPAALPPLRYTGANTEILAHYLDLHFQKDGFGSDGEVSKNW